MSNPYINAYEGLGQGLTAGEAISAGDLVCIKDADGEVYKAQAGDVDLMPAMGIAETDCDEDDAIEVKVRGRVTGESGLNEGRPVFLSTTAGAVTQDPANGMAQVVGIAITATDYILCIQPPVSVLSLQATESGDLTSSSTGNFLWAAPTSGRVIDVGLRVGTTGTDGDDDLYVEGDINIGGTTCMDTLPKVDQAATDGDNTFVSGTGLTQGVMDTAANDFEAGDELTYDLDLERTASPSDEIADITIIALVALGLE
jgi:hypothetical protein